MPFTITENLTEKYITIGTSTMGKLERQKLAPEEPSV
jgi:hypothetical protein